MNQTGSLRTKILFLIGIFIAALAFSAAMPSAEAGTVFAQPEPQPKVGPGEGYAESRFGRPPAPVDTGVDSHYARHAVEEMETSDEGVGGVSRSPAGLTFTDAATVSTVQSTSLGESRTVASSKPSMEPASSGARKGVQEIAIIASDLGFFPKTVFVSREVPVRLFVTGSSKNTLCIMMDSFQVRKQVRSQKIEEIAFTPNVPGKYRFYCPVNGMEGTLIVKEFANTMATSDAPDSGTEHRNPAGE